MLRSRRAPPRARRPERSTSGDTEYGACGTTCAAHRGERCALDVRCGRLDHRRRIGRVEADDLAEHDAVEAAVRQRRLARRRVGDIADGGRAGLERVDDPLA